MGNVKSLVVMGTAVAGLLAVGGLAVAQGRGGGPRGSHPGGPMQIRAGSSGVYLLQGNVLLKYAAGSLAPAGSVKVADDPTAPVDGRRPMGPPAGELTLWKDASGVEQVLLVVGGCFVRVDGASMTVKAKSELPKPPEPALGDEPLASPDDGPGGPGGRPGPMMGRGEGQPMQVVDGIAYLHRGPQVLAISVADGKVVGTAELSKPPVPAG